MQKKNLKELLKQHGGTQKLNFDVLKINEVKIKLKKSDKPLF